MKRESKEELETRYRKTPQGLAISFILYFGGLLMSISSFMELMEPTGHKIAPEILIVLSLVGLAMFLFGRKHFGLGIIDIVLKHDD